MQREIGDLVRWSKKTAEEFVKANKGALALAEELDKQEPRDDLP